MLTLDPCDTKRLVIIIYDSDYQELANYQLPVSIVDSFANRLFEIVLGSEDLTVDNPHYSLIPRFEDELHRSPLLPVEQILLQDQLHNGVKQSSFEIITHPKAPVRYFEIRLFDFHSLVYHGTYTTDDVFLHIVCDLLHARIEKGELSGVYYYIVLPDFKDIHPIPTDLLEDESYRIEEAFHVTARAENEPRIIFRRVQEKPLPECDPTTFMPFDSCGRGRPRLGRVFIPAHIYNDLSGYLGNIYT